jgi:hypothetical protein
VSGGGLINWTQTDAGNGSSQAFYGTVGLITNNTLITIGGQTSGGGYANDGLTASIKPQGGGCNPSNAPCITWAGGNAGISLVSPRYAAGLVPAGGVFYFIGGRSAATTVLSSVERGGY